ncbi:MAG: ribosome maturation factor RimM [Thermoanaerobaculia bacterium]
MVATVRRPHGLRGEILVDLQSDVPGRLAPGDRIEVVSKNGERSVAQVSERRQHPRGTLIRLEGVDDRSQADLLRGALFEVQRHQTPPAPDGSYYYFELVGCQCVDSRQGELGQVTGVVEDGGGLILEISDGRQRILIPFVRDYVRTLDVVDGRIELELPEGLVEACASTS